MSLSTCSFLKALKIALTENKNYSEEMRKLLIAYRTTPHQPNYCSIGRSDRRFLNWQNVGDTWTVMHETAMQRWNRKGLTTLMKGGDHRKTVSPQQSSAGDTKKRKQVNHSWGYPIQGYKEIWQLSHSNITWRSYTRPAWEWRTPEYQKDYELY